MNLVYSFQRDFNIHWNKRTGTLELGTLNRRGNILRWTEDYDFNLRYISVYSPQNSENKTVIWDFPDSKGNTV